LWEDADGVAQRSARGVTAMMRKWFLAAVAAWCPLLWAAELAPSEFMSVGIQERSTGTFYVAGAIDGIGNLDMLVDTGSSYLVITDTMLQVLKTADRVEFSRNLEGRMADGSTRIIPLYRIAGLRLGESCWLHDVEAAVFPAGSRPILGMNVLARLAPFTFSTRPGQLGLSHCEKAPPAPAAEDVRAEPIGPAEAPSAPPTGAAD